MLDTFPAGDDITLGNNQNFYVRLAYETDEPVRIWVRPWHEGREVAAGSNPSPVYSGSGEALGWFFFMQGDQRVDEIRITAGDGSVDGTQLVLAYPVRIRAGDTASGLSPESLQEPEWVTNLRNENDRLQREAYERQVNEPVSSGDTLLFGGFMLAVLLLGLGGIVAPAWAVWRWRGAWRLAAAVPLFIVGFVVLRIVVDTARDPTSHNLWPFELLQAGFLSVVIMAVLWLARRYLDARIR